jgi:glycosyltransferase involved in cell wall biosynthesis
MFGWEFPPHITGGLGTACHGLSTRLATLVDRLTFVLPRVKARVPSGAVEVVGVGDVVRTEGEAHAGLAAAAAPAWTARLPESLEMLAIPSTLRPYLDDEAYRRWVTQVRTGRPAAGAGNDGAASAQEPGLLQLSGDYGPNLFEEVDRYAAVAGQAARLAAFDVVHAHDWMTFPAGMEAKRLCGTPFIAHVHALEPDRSGARVNQAIFDLERLGMERADRIIAVSQRTKDTAVHQYGIDPDKIAVVHNGADLEPSSGARAAHPLGGKLVVFLGRVTMQKGPEYFLEAARRVADALPDARFAMAGSGDMLPRMIARMAELDLLERFHFTGFVDAPRRDALLRQADLLVMPSVSEPFGLVPLEAVARGVPVIITKQSGVAEVLHSAFKVDFWDVRRMADVMIHVLTNPSLRRQLVDGAAVDLAGMSWERAAARVRDVYRELLS